MFAFYYHLETDDRLIHMKVFIHSDQLPEVFANICLLLLVEWCHNLLCLIERQKGGIVFQLPELLDKLSAKWGRVAIRVAKDSSSRRATRWSSFLLSGDSTGLARSLSLLRRVLLFFFLERKRLRGTFQ